MCGICGEFYFDKSGKAGLEKVRRMAGLMEHRGPDQEGFFVSRDESLALGHRRLKIIDLSTGDQPMTNEDGSLVIVFNGEIYNFPELRAELEAKGHQFKSRSDTEVTIHLFEQEGLAGFARMAGMFALALFDEKSQSLVLARDHFGVKPLFYFADPNRLVFASELRALVCGLGALPSLRKEAIFDYLMLQYVPGPETIFEGAQKLKPGGYLLADQAGVRTGKFFSLNPGAVSEKPVSRGQALEEVRQALEQSVRSQMVADVPVGAFLSGGIDSSTIVALMKRIKVAGVKTFSVDFSALGGAGEVNETFFSNFAAEYFKTEHSRLKVSAEDAIKCLEEVVAHLDEPVADPACLPTYLISRLARSEVTVVLSGEGADELFGGYLRHRLERLAMLFRFFRFPPLPRFLEKAAENFPNTHRVRKALRALAEKDPGLRHILWASVFAPDRLEELLVDDGRFLESLALKFSGFFAGQPDHFNNVLWADFGTWLADELLVKVDRMSMAVSLEARVPYLDHRLVEKVFALPAAWKFGFLSGKKIFKEAVRGLIPETIIARKKAGFTLPLGKWFRSELQDLLRGHLSAGELSAAGIFEPRAVAQILESHFSGREDLSLQLFSILLLQLWAARIKDWVK